MSDDKDPIVEIDKEKIEPDTEVILPPQKEAETVVEGEKKAPPAAEPQPNKEFDDLKVQYAALQAREEEGRERARAAEARARQHEQEIAAARDEIDRTKYRVVEGDYQTILTAINGATSERDAAKAELRSAFDTGDRDKFADAQEKIATAAARLVALEEGKSAIEQRAEASRAAQAQPRQERQPQRQAGDQFEAALQQFTPRTQAWVRQHPETMTDQKTHQRAMAAHWDAVENEKLTADTDEYFAYLDQRLRYAAADPGKVSVQKHTRAAPAAPVSRDTATASGNLTGDRVKLTPREVRAAEDLGLSLTEYAKRKQIMTKEGRYATMALPSE